MWCGIAVTCAAPALLRRQWPQVLRKPVLPALHATWYASPSMCALNLTLDLVHSLSYYVSVTTQVALSNSFGFGGHNSCIMFRKYEP